MFGKLFCVFLVLCGSVNSAEYISGTFIKKISQDMQIKQPKITKAKLHKIMPAIKNGDTRTKNISKRGIVMVDSDFDIPSEIYTYENNLDNDDVFEKNEGSGTSESNELVKSTEDDISSMSELQKWMNISTVLTQSTAKYTQPTTEKTDTVISISTEGSGDESLITEEHYSTKNVSEHYSTTEVSTKSYTTPDYDIQEKISDICMNITCDTNDLNIFTSEERKNIPEGNNFTLTCKSNNHSLHDMLYWYKSNGSEYFLQTLGTNAQLHLNIPNTKLMHSGIYVCVKRESKQTCCNVKSNLIIYEVPFYQYHLIIIGLVILVGVVLCIFLSVRKSIALKKYTKEFAERHGKFKSLL